MIKSVCIKCNPEVYKGKINNLPLPQITIIENQNSFQNPLEKLTEKLNNLIYTQFDKSFLNSLIYRIKEFKNILISENSKNYKLYYLVIFDNGKLSLEINDDTKHIKKIISDLHYYKLFNSNEIDQIYNYLNYSGLQKFIIADQDYLNKVW